MASTHLWLVANYHFNWLKTAYLATLEVFVFLLILLLLGVLWLPAWAFRCVAVAASKLFVSGIGEPLSFKDVHLHENFKVRHALSIVTMMSLKGDISAETLRELALRNVLQSKLVEGDGDDSSELKLRFPQLTQFQTTFLGFPFWKDDPQFDVANHIHEVFHDGADTPDYFKSVEGLAGEFTGRPYPSRRSPWEVRIVRNFPDEEEEVGGRGSFKTVVMVRAHHSMMDGYSMLNVLHHFCGKPPITVPPAYILKQKNLLSQGWRLRTLLDYCLQSSLEVKRHRQFKQDVLDGKIWGGEDVRDKVHFGYSPLLPLSQVKAVASKFGVRVPAVLSTLLAEGISDVFQDELGVVNAPYAIPLLDRPGNLTNHAHMSTLVLPTFKAEPITTKLKVINESYLELASHPSIVALEILTRILGNFPRSIAPLVKKRLHYTPISISNFWMGSESYQLGGLDVVDIRAALGVPGDQVGSVAIILGYKDHVRILFAGHESLYSEADVESIASGTLRNLEMLMQLDA